MQIDTNKVEDNKVQINIKIPKTEVDKSVNEIAEEFKPKVKINGFRDGKVPLSVIKTRYGKDLLAEASSRLIDSGASEALKDPELRNISNPVLLEEFRSTKIKPYLGKLHLDGSMSFIMEVELPPNIDVKDYCGVQVEVDSKDFEGWFKKKIYEQQMIFGTEDLADRPAKDGDELVVDFEGTIDGSPMEGGKEEDYRVTIGEGNLPKEFEEAFIGKTPGEEFSVPVEFAEDYHNSVFAGKTIEFNCTLKEVYELTPHELNDELAELLSYESVEVMMDAHKGMWEEQFEAPMRAQVFNAIMEEILRLNEFTAPEAWIDNEVKNTLQRLSAEGFTDNTMMDTVRELSEKTVKTAYLLDRIYEKEEAVHLGAEEFKNIAAEEAGKQGMGSGELLIQILKKNNQYEGFVTFHEQQRTINYLVENAIVREKKDDSISG